LTGPRWLDDEQQRAWRLFQVMQVRLAARLANDLSSHSELSYQDYLVLVALTDQPEGRMRVFELARDLGWEKSRISHQVARMAQRGLVEKVRCGADRRGATVCVSALGRARIEEAAPSHVDAVRRLFVDHLTPVQMECLAEISATVLRAVSEDEGCCTPGP
jgi:DNA-binding MarR family transcriptional regulator